MHINMEPKMIASLEHTLESMSIKLGHIEEQLKDIVRLQERVSNQDKTLTRFGDKIDRHDVQLHQTEIWRANMGEKADLERMIDNIREDIRDNARRISSIESASATSNGQKDVVKEILKWATGILGAIVIFMLTGK